MGLTVNQLKGADSDLVLKAAEAWQTQVTKLNGLIERYRTNVKEVVADSGWEGSAYFEAYRSVAAELTALENAHTEADAIRLALEMAAANIDHAQDLLRTGLEQARENGARVAPDGSLELGPALTNDPEVWHGPVGERLREAQQQIQYALRVADEADERIAWDLEDDTGTRREHFNGRAHQGPGQSPGTILREYQVTDDPRGMTDYYGERITQGEANMLDDLSLADKLDFRDIQEQALAEAQRRFPEDHNDGHMDAFRHAYWNALMAKRFGMEWTEQYGMAHERLPGNPSDREAMDLFNNEVGRNVALNNPTAPPGELADEVEQAVRSGQTRVIDRDGRLMPSDRVGIGEHGHTDKVPGAPDEGIDLGDPGEGS